MLQGDKGLRDLIAVAQENSLELGDSAIEIDKEGSAPVSASTCDQAATLAKFFSGTWLA
jgi:hypothetical protein